MKINKWWPVLLLVPLLIAASGCQGQANPYRSYEAAAPREKTGTLTFEVALPGTAATQKVELWLPYPVSNDYQQVSDVRVSGNYTTSGVYRETQYGNMLLYARWDGPREDARLSLACTVTRREMVRKAFPAKEGPLPPGLEQYLAATSLAPVTGQVKLLAEEVTQGRGSILAKATALYDFIVEKGQRDPSIIGCGEGDVCRLITDLRGKCVDLSSVFVALARSVGVPTREVLGIRLAQNGEVTSAYHCRAEFYLPGYGWVPVDPSDVRKLVLNENLPLSDPRVQAARSYFFGAQSETYVDLSTGRDLTLSPTQAGGPLNYLMYPYAEVNGQPLPGELASPAGMTYKVTCQLA